MKKRRLIGLRAILLYLIISMSGILLPVQAQEHSVARQWNEAMLFCIRRDFARPTIHARNIFHTCMAMYDAWAAFEPSASPYLLGNQLGTFQSEFNGILIPEDRLAAQNEAISYAAYRLLRQRFQNSPGGTVSLGYLDSLLTSFGYSTSFLSQNYSNGSPAALGNYVANQIIQYGFTDGSNQQGNYANLYYQPVNPEIIVNNPGNPTMVDPNRWQRIFLDGYVDQSGNPISISPPALTPEWGNVVPFSMTDDHKTVFSRDGNNYNVYLDPGPPPLIDTNSITGLEDAYKKGFLMVSTWQGHLDPTDGVMWDISPGAMGNVETFPSTYTEDTDFHNFLEGGDPGTGNPINPKTGLPYEPQIVPRGDYARVLAEFWADGPSSETPPGHWFSILNYVGDSPLFEKKWMGEGNVLSNLEWDIRSYFTLAGAMHDAAIAAWALKGWYDYPRPVSIIRWMAEKGQASDPDLPRFHPAGMPLIPGHVELVMEGDPLVGDNNEHLHKLKLYTWKGPYHIEDPETEFAGVDWILAEEWWPYQRPNFVTPPFSGYISGHSTYSRTAAEVMTLITGDRYFPGGLGEFLAPQNNYLEFEIGPSVDVRLQWATYQDASDQCSLSRIWGGIHPPQDDLPGRVIGQELGPLAVTHARNYIEAGLPYIVSTNITSSVLSDIHTGSPVVLGLTFNEPMNSQILPQVTLTGANTGGSLGLLNAYWFDEFTFNIEYVFIDENIETSAIGARVTGAVDLEGNMQKIAMFPNLFRIDTKNPLVSSCSFSTNVVLADMASAETFEVTISYNEPMLNVGNVQVTWQASDLVNALTYDNVASSWIDNQTFRAVFEVNGIAEEHDAVQAMIFSAYDAAGNEQAVFVDPMLIQIDTKRPSVSLLESPNYVLSSADIGDGSFEISVHFDEDMDEMTIPLIEIDNELIATTALQFNESLSGWESSNVYTARFDVQFASVYTEGVGIRIFGARDINTNLMEFNEVNSYFSVLLDTTLVNVNIPSTADIHQVYPNPVRESDPITIAWSENFNPNELIITGMDGRVVKHLTLSHHSGHILTLSDEGLAAGLYITTLKNNVKASHVRIIISK